MKTPPTNPGGIWNERIPGGGTLGGAVGPIIGVPRDSCTPRGGRTGIVMQAISLDLDVAALTAPHAPKAQVAHPGVDHLRHPRRRAEAQAIVRRAQV